MRSRRGFTLLEVMVATTIMAIAVTTLLSALGASIRTANRVTDADRAAVLAERVMGDLMAGASIGEGVVEQRWDRSQVNLDGGWRARSEAFAQVGNKGLERIVLEVWWMSGSDRRTFQLEGYRPVGIPVGGPR